MDSAPTRRRGVVLVLFPLQGHITPMLQLGTILYAKGFSVTVVHPEFSAPNSSNHPEFTFLPLPVNLSGREASFLDPDPFLFVSAMNDNCKSSLQEHVVQMQGTVACIIYDSLMSVTESVAHQFGVPSIVVRTVCAANLLTHPVILQLHQQNQIPLPETQLEDPITSLEFLRFKDLPFSVASAIPQHWLPTIESFSNVRSSNAVILNSVECLEKQAVPELQHEYKLVPLFTIGPFHKMAPRDNPTTLVKEDRNCIKWLDEQTPNSVIYVSLGSLAKIEKEELLETAWGLVESEHPFLWVIRSDLVSGSENWIDGLPEGLVKMIEERGRVLKWAPQREILAHRAIGAFLSHCGWNSTLEGISEGVPMLCRPCFADQLVNARYISQVWRVGFELENARDRTVVKSSVKRLLVGEDGKEMKQRALDLKQKLELSVQKGGSSYNSLENLTQFILSLKL